MEKKNIRILIQENPINLSETTLIQKAHKILSALAYDAHELSIVITDNAGIREMNRTYREKDRPTNVLAFPMMNETDVTEPPFPVFPDTTDPDAAPLLLGDVVISAEQAAREAQEAGVTLDERISQLLIHGILHLVGYDHEQGETAAQEMESKSLELIRLIESNSNLDIF